VAINTALSLEAACLTVVLGFYYEAYNAPAMWMSWYVSWTLYRS